MEHYEDVMKFLEELGITIEEYQKNIGSRPRFDTVKEIYGRYKTNCSKLILELQKFIDNPQNGRLHLVRVLYQIIESRPSPMNSNIINKLLNMNRLKIKTVVDEVRKYYTTVNIDAIISTTIRMKSSYIEHIFYPKVLLIMYFRKLSKIDKNLVDILNKKIIEPIDFLYFASSKQRKMLVDLGIYERDVETIVKVIGDDYEDAFELKRRLQDSWDKMKNISFISKYVIQNLI